MKCVEPVREIKQEVILAIVHKNGSAKVHTVTKGSNKKFYNLIKTFRANRHSHIDEYVI